MAKKRLTKKLITEVISDELGMEAVHMALYLKGKEDVSELIIAKDMKIKVQDVRAILYRMFEQNLVKFERKRDKHKGWHISHWDFLPENVFKLHNKKHKQEIRKIKNRINKEENNAFYMCKYACARIDFDKAIAMNFKCPECGTLMNPQDNKRTIEVLNGKLKELQEQVS